MAAWEGVSTDKALERLKREFQPKSEAGGSKEADDEDMWWTGYGSDDEVGSGRREGSAGLEGKNLNLAYRRRSMGRSCGASGAGTRRRRHGCTGALSLMPLHSSWRSPLLRRPVQVAARWGKGCDSACPLVVQCQLWWPEICIVPLPPPPALRPVTHEKLARYDELVFAMQMICKLNDEAAAQGMLKAAAQATCGCLVCPFLGCCLHARPRVPLLFLFEKQYRAAALHDLGA